MTQSIEVSDLGLIGRTAPIFVQDLNDHRRYLSETVAGARFLVIGAAGSIGQAVTKEIFARKPAVLDAVDISENNLVELVRDIRSSLGYIDGDFRTFALDCGSAELEAMWRMRGAYDYVLNLSALKHVRSEKDPYTLMRMIEVNVANTALLCRLASETGAKKFFSVSTDKATAPVNLMGATKRLMEHVMLRDFDHMTVSTARFANVAFSDGSLLHGFHQRLIKRQPFSAPNDVERYFITATEAGQLCLLSTLLGSHLENFVPKQAGVLRPTKFSDIAVNFLANLGYTAEVCSNEEEARARVGALAAEKKWPCYFFQSDTTGEKQIESFFEPNEQVNFDRYADIGVVTNAVSSDTELAHAFLEDAAKLKQRGHWTKDDLTALFRAVLPALDHADTGKYLDGKM